VVAAAIRSDTQGMTKLDWIRVVIVILLLSQIG